MTNKKAKNEKSKIPEEEFEEGNIGKLQEIVIVDEMRQCYLDYAMSVIVARALPDVRDGLKPVHRRILYAMHDMGLRPQGRFKKSASVVGEVLGKYHPHGDTAVYDSMVRMAQDFSMRYMMVNGQGNFGSMDGDSAAAMRYTEAKLRPIAEEMVCDINKNTVNFIDNYDKSRKEPAVLPARVPQLLLNGAVGIAVGMATNIPPHNLGEVVDATLSLIDHPDSSIEDLVKFVKGPDFPTGGYIYNHKDILQAYATGKGKVDMRAKADIVEDKKGKFQIIVSEMIYQVNKSTLIEKMADLVKDKKIEGIRDLRDESSKEGVRIVIDLKADAYPKKVLNQLYKLTDLQRAFHFNMLALVDGIQPRVLNLKAILEYYIIHREEVVRRKTQYDLDKAKERAHILEGLSKALDHIDEVIQTIKKAPNKEKAHDDLMKKFKLSDLQASAILEMRLQTLSGLEQQKIKDELDEKLRLIKELETILGDRNRIMSIIKGDLKEVRDKYADERKTKVIKGAVGDFSHEDLMPKEDVVISITRAGYIKRMELSEYHVQHRGGKGVTGGNIKEEDMIDHFFIANTHGDILFFTNMGRVFQIKAYEIPVASRTSKGQAIVNFLQLSQEEKVTAAISLEKETIEKFLVMVTRNGIIKKTGIEEFAAVRRSGLIAINLKAGDELIWVKMSSGTDEAMIVASNGQSIRFQEKDVRPMGRSASGVTAIKLKGGAKVIGMGVFSKADKLKNFVFTIAENGFGKISDLNLYKIQNRGGSGIKTAILTNKTGQLVSAYVVDEEEIKKDLMIISRKGQIIRIPFSSVAKSGRATQGVRVMRTGAGDAIASATTL
ncbi:MAG: DNA gyrase subunit A [Candidatus Pacebacteria bacterium]|nr:DNA gyrase subunit A [Candidatus Paceibacterota bacterium]